MRSIIYGLLLLVLLTGSILLLRSVQPSRNVPTPAPRFPGAVSPEVTTINAEDLDATDPQQLHEIGVEFMRMWRVREAAVVFEHAVRMDSTRADSWIRLAELYAHPLIDDENSLAWAIDRAIAASGSDSAYADALGRLYLDRDYEGAAGAFAALLKTRDAPEVRYHLALTSFLLGRLDDCGRQLAPLMRSEASVGPVVELYVRRAVAAGELDRAADAARGLARLYSEEPFPYVLLAQVEMARANAPAATEFCNNALLLDPQCIPAIMTRALLYAAAGEFEAARVSYEKLLLFDEPVLRSIGEEGIGFVDFLSGEFDAGIEAMDEAIRLAMLSDSSGRGLSLSLRLVEYLCQLGQADAAENVVERWLTGSGEVPVRIARARIQILRGDLESAKTVVDSLFADGEWLYWARTMQVDVPELTALTDIGLQRQKDALALLAADSTAAAVNAGGAARRSFLTGYAAFETGDAERAAAALSDVRSRICGPEFPYHGDPVLYVQAAFFLAEAELARGNQEAAQAGYQQFIDSWGDAAWDLEAVARARRKMEALGAIVAPPHG